MAPVADASAESLHAFVVANVEPVPGVNYFDRSASIILAGGSEA
jgi:hypothetical protein